MRCWLPHTDANSELFKGEDPSIAYVFTQYLLSTDTILNAGKNKVMHIILF